MVLNTLEDLFIDQLRDLYDSEAQLLGALADMVEAATNEDLKNAFQTHLEQTKRHRERLERTFTSLGMSPDGETCEGMRGLLEEGSEMIEQRGDPAVVDAGIIAAAQRVEHYEIAGYGTARAYAELLGLGDAAELLQKTLDEEEATDQKLSSIAMSTVNREAQRTTSRA